MQKAGKASYDGSGVRTPTEITTAVFTPVAELKTLLQMELPAGGFQSSRCVCLSVLYGLASR
ncbi:hypothetical protein QIU18_00175 [Capnocytophaga canimorsus]|nr:hypothetical protein [Capnocytophaga canimorsus]WGU68288.1 hypothetical protein QIU19_13635 [Capnocytophaga canimorsus]WGU70611.1 hypothetical protein QIU18_00175 [Capnocytophaga canimorsus]